jgi:hypothetical protein
MPNGLPENKGAKLGLSDLIFDAIVLRGDAM